MAIWCINLQLLAIILSFWLCCANNCTSFLPAQEYDSLYSMYQSCNGGNWRWDPESPNSTRWHFPSTLDAPCMEAWQGIICTPVVGSSNCTISTLDLHFKKLRGVIPHSIGNLSSLVVLNLQDNELSSTIPTEVVKLSQLERLYMADNFFKGSLPVSLYQMTKLKVISVEYNFITGSIPSSISNLRLLELYYVEYNAMTGKIPTQIGNLANLEFFSVGHNEFVGSIPTQIGNNRKLEGLYLYENYFTGNLPTEIGYLSNLLNIWIEDNSFEGLIPSEIGNLVLLQNFLIDSNHLSGNLPIDLCRISTWVSFDIGYNYFHGHVFECFNKSVGMQNFLINNNYFSKTIPESFKMMSALQQFDVFSNLLTGTMPTFLFKIESMVELLLGDNALYGTVPSEIGLLIHLLSLDVSQTQLSGTIPTEIGKTESLRLLNLYNTWLTGSIPSHITEIVFLEILAVSNNFMSGTLPYNLCAREGLGFATFDNNYFSGTLPDGILNIYTMVSLSCGYNYFEGLNPLHQGLGQQVWYVELNSNLLTGSLPSRWSGTNISSLEYLLINNNLLTGSIPIDFELPNSVSIRCNCSVPSLVQLDLSNNLFHGQLSPAIGYHTALSLLSLSSNSFTGTIPTEYGQLRSLSTFNLSQNQLSGSLEIMFGSSPEIIFPNLTYVILANNSFTGKIPPSVFLADKLVVVTLSSNCFTGSIPSSICYSSSLQTIVMNAVSIGKACRVTVPSVLQRFVHGIFSNKQLMGTIPSCIWSLTTLETLQLGGNQLQGSLEDITYLSSSLTNLVLGYNQLTGTIPYAIQNHGYFSLLSLQHNKLSGTLSPNFAVVPPSPTVSINDTMIMIQHLSASSVPVASNNNMTLKLQVNRLSGKVPASFASVEVIQVLNGNLFQCGSTVDLPRDASSQSYSCGSSSLNTALSLWCAIIGINVLILAGMVIILSYFSQYSSHSPSEKAFFGSRLVSQMLTDLNLVRKYPIGGERSTTLSVVNDQEISCIDAVKAFIVRICFDSLLWISFKYSSTHWKLMNTYQFLDVISLASKAVIILVAVFVSVCMTTFILMKIPTIASGYSTHQLQYGWITTAAFLSGKFPALFIFFIIFVSLWIFCRQIIKLSHQAHIVRHSSSLHGSLNSPFETEFGVSASSALKKKPSLLFENGNPIFEPSGDNCNWYYIVVNIMIPVSFQLINFIVTLMVNGVYVYLLQLKSISRKQVLALPFLVSIFKGVWSVTFVPFAMRFMVHLSATPRLCNQSTMYIIILIVSPLIAALYADESCFYEVFVNAPPVLSSYSDTSQSLYCVEELFYKADRSGYIHAQILAQCGLEVMAETVYSSTTPPFIYSYQCGSSILTDFAPVLLYSYLFSTILPFLRFVVLHTSQETLQYRLPQFFYTNVIANTLLECDAVTLGRHQESIRIHPTAGHQIEMNDVIHDDTTNENVEGQQGSSVNRIKFAATEVTDSRILISNRFKAQKSKSIFQMNKPKDQLFDGATVVARRLLDFAVMLSYGLACPLLGVAVAFNVILNSAVWRMMVGKYLAAAGTDNDKAFRTLEHCTKDMLSGVVGSMWVVVFTVCLFWSIQLFDIMADVEGNNAGIGLLVALLVGVPVGLYAIMVASSQYTYFQFIFHRVYRYFSLVVGHSNAASGDTANEA